MTYILVFLVSGAVVVLAGTAMARQADRIAELTGNRPPRTSVLGRLMRIR